MSLPTRGAWIEICTLSTAPLVQVSLPTRGAWIEIVTANTYINQDVVAPHTGSVD